MYNPAHFAETDTAEIERLMHDHPLAALVAQTALGLDANHVPLLRDGEGFVGHVALANPVHADIPDDAPVLAIFRAAQAYVSPNWYPSKAETHKAVPTWNYQVVHVHGTLRWSHAEKDKRRAVSLLTARHERATNGADAWRMADAPADYMTSMLAKIVALRIEIGGVIAKAKLSQNRELEDFSGVVRALEARGLNAMSERMRRIGKGREEQP
ncbi:MAG: FMN-binding negative transcriptional regulator [Hyphomicrobiaceae bacterium]|nr:FMN-binding negative transcriptional regulator [Hyphomicrobiaceae bacterium]